MASGSYALISSDKLVIPSNLAPKRSDKLIIPSNRPFLQLIKPSHSYRPQTRRKNFTHQGLVLRIYGHTLIVMIDMLHGICLTIVNCKSWPNKPLWQVCFLSLLRMGGLRYLIQSLTHSILTGNVRCCKDPRVRERSFKPLFPTLLFSSDLVRRWRNCSLLERSLFSLFIMMG